MSASLSVSQTSAPPAVERKTSNLATRILSNFLLRRIVKAIVTIWFVVTLTFFLVHLMPGNPIDAFINNQMAQYGVDYKTAASMAASLFSLDLKRPLPLQYLDFMGGLLHGDLGKS